MRMKGRRQGRTEGEREREEGEEGDTEQGGVMTGREGCFPSPGARLQGCDNTADQWLIMEASDLTRSPSSRQIVERHPYSLIFSPERVPLIATIAVQELNWDY